MTTTTAIATRPIIRISFIVIRHLAHSPPMGDGDPAWSAGHPTLRGGWIGCTEIITQATPRGVRQFYDDARHLRRCAWVEEFGACRNRRPSPAPAAGAARCGAASPRSGWWWPRGSRADGRPTVSRPPPTGPSRPGRLLVARDDQGSRTGGRGVPRRRATAPRDHRSRRRRRRTTPPTTTRPHGAPPTTAPPPPPPTTTARRPRRRPHRRPNRPGRGAGQRGPGPAGLRAPSGRRPARPRRRRPTATTWRPRATSRTRRSTAARSSTASGPPATPTRGARTSPRASGVRRPCTTPG